jgi:RNA polymerase sigma factor (sigma-70 family)
VTAPAAPGSLATRAAEAFAAYRSGDTERMSELVDLMSPLLWHTARAQRADPALAEDVVQTAWLRLVDRAGEITDPQAVMQWLLMTVRREAWRLVRQGDRARPASEVVEAEVATPITDDPEAVSILSERQQVLWQHVAQLSDRCRELLRVVAFADRPDYATVAAALAMPVGSIGPTRGRCLHKLRAALVADARWGG